MNAKRAFGLGFVALLTLLSASAALAEAWGDPFLISPAGTDKYHTHAAMDAAGNAVVGWTQDLLQPAGDNETDVFAQRLDAAGAPVGAPIRLNENTDEEEWLGDLSMDAAGNFVAVWQSFPSYSVHGRCFAANGAPRTGDFALDTGERLTFEPAVAVADDGRFVVAWIEQYSGNGYDYQLHARLFSANCQPLGQPILVNNVNGGDEHEPAIAMDAAGNFVIVWQGDDSYGPGVFARRFNRDGAPLGGQVRVNQRQRFGQYDADVAMDGAGRFTVAYTSEVGRLRGGFDYDVLVRRYNANGVALTGEFRPHSRSIAPQTRPALALRRSGELAVLWTHSNNDYSSDLLARLYDAQGKPTGPARLISEADADEYLGAVAARSAAPFLAAWPRGIGANTEIWGRLLGGAGAPKTTTFTPTNDAFTSSAGPNTVFNTRRLNVKNASQDYVTYLKFNVSSLTGAAQSARLRLWVVDTGYSAGGVFAVPPYYNGTTTQWLETGLMWNNAPTFSGSPLGSLGINPPLNQWIEVDVTPAVLTALAGDGRVSLAIPGNDSDVVAFSSKEGAHAPELVVATE